MGISVTLSLPGSEMVFGAAMEEAGVQKAALESVVPVGSAGVVLVWVYDGGYDEYEAALEADSRIGGVDLFEAFEDRRLYRAVCVPDGGLLSCITGTDGVVMRAAGRVDRWEVELWFPDNAGASAFHDACRDSGVDFEVERIRTLAPPETDSYGLSSEQVDLLRTAHKEGYFEVPRQCTLNDLAEEWDVSDQSISARLRRAEGTLVGNTLG